jgi:peroxiredoxin
MKVFAKSIITSLFYCVFSGLLFSQTIIIEHNELTNETMKIASRYGDNIFIERELKTNDLGKSIFYFDSLHSGIYYVILPDSSSYEFMYDSDFAEKIVFELSNRNTLKVSHAPEPTLKYDEYISITSIISKSLDSIKLELKQNGLKAKQKKILLKERDLLLYRQDSIMTVLLKNYKSTLLGAYLKAHQKVEVPDYTPPQHIANKDSAIWAWRLEYFHKHFLDNLNLSDARLIYTPIYTVLINQYLDKITLQEVSELKIAIDNLLSNVQNSVQSKVFLTDYLLKKFSMKKNSPIYEVVYLYIIEKYYLKNNEPWLSAKDIETLTREYNSRKALEIGRLAPEIKLKNSNGNESSLYSIESDFTILYFNNYDCDLCKKTSPALKKLFYKYPPSFLNVYSVCLGEDDKKCEEFSKNNEFSTWINVFDNSKINEIATEYNLKYTPTLFLLNKKKQIISKNLTIDQLDEILEEYSNK